MSRYAAIDASSVVITVVNWDGVSPWNGVAGMTSTVLLTSGEECGSGWTYSPSGSPRFTAPTLIPAVFPAPDDATYILQTAKTDLKSSRVLASSTSITTSYATPGQVDFQRAALTGDVTASANSNATTIAANAVKQGNLQDGAVAYSKIQNVTASDRILGRQSAGAGVVEEITCTSAGRAILDDADATAQRTTLGLGTVATESTVPIGKGGTGQTTAVAAFDALSPQTTKGDLIAHNGTDAVRLAVGGTNGLVLTVDSTAATGVAWAAATAGSTTTVTEYTYTTSGTYTKPAGLKYVVIEGVGGGGGGGAGSTTAGGNGGCAGLYTTVVIPEALITTSTLTVTVGTGGGAGVQGGDSEVTLASGGARLLYMPGGRAATNDMRNLQGGVTTNGFGAGQTAANATAGRHGGYGPGGGGPGNTTAANAAGLAGGRPCSHEFSGGNAQTGGGAAGGAAGGGAGTNATVTVRGFGEGAGGGGANNAGAGGAGGNGTRGSGGGGGGRGSTAGGAGGSGGDGFIRIIEVVVT